MRASLLMTAVLLPLAAAACSEPPRPPTARAAATAPGTGTATGTETATATAPGTETASETGTAPASGTGTATAPATGTAPVTGAAPATATSAAPVAAQPPAKPRVPSPAETAPDPSPATVVADASSDLARKLDAAFADARTFRARFEQTFTIAAQGVEKRSSGIVLVSRPGKLAFVYDAPNGNRLASDGKEIHVYDAGNQQDIVTTVGKAELPGAFGFLMGKGVADAFHFQLNPKAGAGEALLLGKPIEATPAYERVQFTLDLAKLEKKDVGALRGVLILDAQKNRNRFVFSDGAIPGAIDEKAFSFSAPPGTSVKRM